jgi:hypothetical protein
MAISKAAFGTPNALPIEFSVKFSVSMTSVPFSQRPTEWPCRKRSSAGG